MLFTHLACASSEAEIDCLRKMLRTASMLPASQSFDPPTTELCESVTERTELGFFSVTSGRKSILTSQRWN